MSEEKTSLLCKGINSFTTGLHQALLPAFSSSNLVVSPVALHTLLGMIRLGASGKSKEEIISIQKVDLSDDDFGESYCSLVTGLEARANAAEFILNISNRVHCQMDFDFHPSFLDQLMRYFSVGFPELSNFLTSEGEILAAANINEWFENATNGKIKYWIRPRTFKKSTCIVFANTLYFEARWKFPFNPLFTHKCEFHNLDGSSVRVDKLYLCKRLPYCYIQELNLEVVALPLLNGTSQRLLSLILILPKKVISEAHCNYIGSIIHDGNRLIDNLKVSNLVVLKLPKIRLEVTVQHLDKAFADMGMKTLFDCMKAEFRDLSDNCQQSPEAYVSPCLNQKAFIEFDEGWCDLDLMRNVDKSETKVDFEQQSSTNYSETAIPFNIDRPFFFQIVDHTNDDLILFTGHCNNLRAKLKSQNSRKRTSVLSASTSKLDEFSGLIASSGERAIIYNW